MSKQLAVLKWKEDFRGLCHILKAPFWSSTTFTNISLLVGRYVVVRLIMGKSVPMIPASTTQQSVNCTVAMSAARQYVFRVVILPF
jgi:hypothetical protein